MVTTDSLYAQLHIPLDTLLSGKPLYQEAFHYLVSCKVENKAPKTIRIYSQVLNAFLKFNQATKVGPDDVRLYLLSVQERGGYFGQIGHLFG